MLCISGVRYVSILKRTEYQLVKMIQDHVNGCVERVYSVICLNCHLTVREVTEEVASASTLSSNFELKDVR